MNTTKWIVSVVVLVIIALGGYLVWGHNSSVPSQTAAVTGDQESGETSVDEGISTDATGSTTTAPASGTTMSGPVTITYTNGGFSPSPVSIKIGSPVTFVNQSDGPMWVASNAHPSHTDYDGTSRSQHCAAGYAGPAPFDECIAVQKGGSYTFTFTKVGTFSYHNHAAPNQQGTVTVTQ